MYKISPGLSLFLRVSTAIFAILITAAQGKPEYFGGDKTADMISFWLGIVVSVENTLFSLVGTGAQPSLTLAGKVQ